MQPIFWPTIFLLSSLAFPLRKRAPFQIRSGAESLWHQVIVAYLGPIVCSGSQNNEARYTLFSST